MTLETIWVFDFIALENLEIAGVLGGFPGFVYGGMIASLFDCHGAGTAAAAKARENDEPIGRFVTASIKVDYLKPTPQGVELEVRGKVVEIKGRKVIVDLRLLAGETLCATSTVVMVQIPETK